MLETLDPIAINSIFQIAQLSSSAALGLTLIMQDGLEDITNFDRLSLTEAVNIARVDEQF